MDSNDTATMTARQELAGYVRPHPAYGDNASAATAWAVTALLDGQEGTDVVQAVERGQHDAGTSTDRARCRLALALCDYEHLCAGRLVWALQYVGQGERARWWAALADRVGVDNG